MSRIHSIDTLIVGQGLAGSLLARQLRKAGRKICVLDDGHCSAASVVAAGMVNPLAGKRLALYPETAHYIDTLERTYAACARDFGRVFFHPLPILRLLQSEAEAERLAERQADTAFAPYIGESFAPGEAIGSARNPYGAFVTHAGGWLDVPALLTALRADLKQTGCLMEARFHYDELMIKGDHIVWRDAIRAHRIIFCQGWQDSRNPWFDWLRWDPIRGDILTVESNGLPNERILNGGKWLLPVGRACFRAGATYEREKLEAPPQASDAESILKVLAETWPDASFELQEHACGVRPGTRTQHPFMGQHPEHPSLWLFGGFGSKGTLLIPACAQMLEAFLSHGQTLPSSMDIARQWNRSQIAHGTGKA